MQDWTWVNEIVRVATLAHDAAGAGMVSNDKDITEAYRNDLGRLVALVEVGIAHGYVDAEGVLQDRPLASGDVAQLKSGGPAMTVGGEGTQWRCYWFDGTEMKHAVLPESALRRVEPPIAPVAASAEPDAWQSSETIPESMGPGKHMLSPDGYQAAGPWFPFAIIPANDDDNALCVWRRPLRKVST